MAEVALEEGEYLACCGSAKFAKEMAAASPFASYDLAVQVARDIWFNRVDVNGWLEAFAAHPAIGQTASSSGQGSKIGAQWSRGEQSTALATATDSTLQVSMLKSF
uniref:2-oxo-4-hydroxy-4-carboxy-5-ureidoimidazoline decarboxylase n=1 Tax=Kalanchoe fedtschenkoi TaxID=63787 RepID=A0A7N0TIS6_KALFE